MSKIFFTLLLLVFVVYGQQHKRIAIINTVDDGEPPIALLDLSHLTDRLREIATEILPQGNYDVMTVQSMVAFLGSQEEMVKKCRASEGCLAKLGREINADYIGQGRIGRFGGDLSIKVELYSSGKGNLISSFTGSSKDIHGLLSIINEKAPVMFRKLPDVPGVKSGSGSISGSQSGGMLTDSRDGKKYKAVKIGEQTWMAENLNYDASGSKCYGNKPENCAKYGRMYNWSIAKKACPSGWHLPSKSEWEVLEEAVGGLEVAGKKLKAKSGWSSNNGADEFGFSALPGGIVYPDGDYFHYIGDVGYWWSASEFGISDAFSFYMGSFYEYSARWVEFNKNYMFSIRCMQN